MDFPTLAVECRDAVVGAARQLGERICVLDTSTTTWAPRANFGPGHSSGLPSS